MRESVTDEATALIWLFLLLETSCVCGLSWYTNPDLVAGKSVLQCSPPPPLLIKCETESKGYQKQRMGDLLEEA